ncbi:putative methyltransferase [Geosmithia morbida]|uniref:Methyltransferase n=1 Tax=Geosmithia morbida TaxID=1094350 RepID=A0A9P5D3C4_9HYPO|nr:putative methyltransferase [Geosmithia morbida]KAF4124787.1 putative methyltransferase [Geosmithia morbida]
MRTEETPSLPSSILPPLRSLESTSQDAIFTALRGLMAIYCPHLSEDGQKQQVKTSALDDDDDDDKDSPLAAIRADAFEKSFVERWLTGFLSRSEMLTCFDSDVNDSRQRAVDLASHIFESLTANSDDDDQQRQEELADYTRDFSFTVLGRDDEEPITVRLNDGLAGQNPKEADDVGLQSWGASIVFSDLLCNEPSRFGLTRENLGVSPRIVDLGAGTGLVSFVLAKLLPRLDVPDSTVIPTDYHPLVLDNLRANVDANFSASASSSSSFTSASLSTTTTASSTVSRDSVPAALLDWAKPSSEPPLHLPADMLFATDVVYMAQHAAWIRNCATGLLAPKGIFWLLVTVRDTGRFDGVSDTVGRAFADEDRPRGPDGRRLTILNEERLEKRKAIGRGDEAGYRLFRIGWA